MSKSLKFNILFLSLLVVVGLGIWSCEEKYIPELPVGQGYVPGVYPNSEITDGPFVYDKGSRYIVKWIDKNREVIEKAISGSDYGSFEADFGFPFELIKNFDNEGRNPDYKQEFSGVEKLVALSDVHGQYRILVKLLKNNGVIDEQNNWIFGTGHLVINGDIFDRGNRVTESLWLIFKLEQQAKAVGGRVHMLLGNHELMVLNKDLRYINVKYDATASKLNTTYDQLYSKNLIIGKWLRTKPVIVKINDMIFNHAGISIEFVSENLNPSITNQLFQEKIIDKGDNVIEADPVLDFLTSSDGPVWYRGYFRDEAFNASQLDIILNHLNASYIIVGHTSMDEIKFYFSGKIIAIDSSIKNGVSGQVLIYNQGVFTVGTLK